ncbi:zinc finger protein 845-like [Schistocerca piceifrons]|uniref:zinc finger protein 845-like n=1 Tax=Schistocerca piceifrons TaxID=274613 RepID=UPI001F5EC913|nr:zinc finger protein 845-like [Schistocerca piceifrons]
MELLNYSNISGESSHCLVCGSHSLSHYVDLTLDTSYTAQSETPVKDKLRAIIGDKWIIPQPNPSVLVCIPCVQLVNQYDIVEGQLYSIKAQLCEKYVSFHGSIESTEIQRATCMDVDKQTAEDSGCTRGKRQAAQKTRSSSGRKKKLGSEKKELLTLEPIHNTCAQGNGKKNKVGPSFHWPQSAVDTFLQNTTHLSEIPGNSHVIQRETDHIIQPYNNNIENTSWKTTQTGSNLSNESSKTHLQDSHNVLPEDELSAEQPEAVYDELHGMLIPGERLRIGIALCVEGSTSYNCCYCGHLFMNDVNLRGHVLSSHQPEVLTAQIPVELGLGTKVNCGVQLSNVTAVSEFAKPFVCIFCDGAFKFKSNIFLHFKEKHTPYKPFSCVDCQENFRRTIELSRHRVYYCPFRKKAQNVHEKKLK